MSNFLFSAWIHGIQYLVPLVTIPVLVRALGVAGFGRYAFAGAFAGYVQVVVDYGFNLTGTRAVSRSRRSSFRTQVIFWNAVWTKVAILVPLLPVGFGMAWLLSDDAQTVAAVMLALVGSLSTSFTPNWLFQGREKLGPISIVGSLGKLLQLLGVVLLVKSSDDLELALAIPATVAILLLFGTGVLALKEIGSWRVLPPRWSGIRGVLREGKEVFASQLGVILTNNTSLILLTKLSTPEQAGAYAIADRIIRAATMVTGPLIQTILPRISFLMKQDVSNALVFIRRCMAYGSAGMGLICLALFFGAPYAVAYFSGSQGAEVLPIVRMLCLMPLLVFWDNLYGTQVLLQMGKRVAFVRSILLGGVVSILVQALLLSRLGATGAAIAALVAESTLLGLFVRECARYGISPTLRRF